MDISAYASYPECYVIQMTQTIDGVSVYAGNHEIALKAGTAVEPGVDGLKPFIWAVITAHGIEELSLMNCFEPIESVQENPALISAEQTIEVIKRYYENIINTETLTINDLKLTYTLLPQSLNNTGAWELWPTWVCQTQQNAGSYDRGGGSRDFTPTENALFIDAVGGQILKERFQK
jgi:hypothetical protein